MTFVYPASSSSLDIDRPTAITSTLPGGNPTTIVSDIVYQGDQLIQWTAASGIVTTIKTNFDGSERQRSAAYGMAKFVDQSISSRDGNSNIKTLVNAAGAAQTQTFAYTDRSELESATLAGSGAYASLAYTYNNAGDRKTATRDGTATATYSYSDFKLTDLKVGGALVREYVYDGSRPLTVFEGTEQTSLLYFRDGLLGISGPFLEGYDGLRRRAFRKQGINEVLSQEFWDTGGNLLSEIGYQSLTAPNPRPVFDYIYIGSERVALLTGTWNGSGVGLPPLASSGPALIDGPAYALHGNHIGATVKATDASQSVVFSAQYEPFGRAVTTGTLNLGLRLPGQYENTPSSGAADDLRLFYNWNRSYDSSGGRYLQPDPIAVELVIASVARGFWSSPYAYAFNNPLLFVDAVGLCPCPGCNECSSDNFSAINERLNEVAQTLAFLLRNKSCGSGPISGRDIYCITDPITGTTVCGTRYREANVCVQCGVDAHEACHRENRPQLLIPGACWMNEAIGYRAEEKCLRELLAGNNQ
ncbi:MAG: RHS repeat domain-containing protein [Myxococcaceae bacterium]